MESELRVAIEEYRGPWETSCNYLICQVLHVSKIFEIVDLAFAKAFSLEIVPEAGKDRFKNRNFIKGVR
ncbi:hypothetical protein [Phyllobacterium sp. SB3]|uniref:hypothetical protein n=1 Tax=Phyllobacterium sp. SB3 TaxID=3156073 RepID=UPI0032AF94A3